MGTDNLYLTDYCLWVAKNSQLKFTQTAQVVVFYLP